ncbi:MAG TPA: hypothetical protein VF340_00700 [Methyloceanibacter sp.]
MKLNRKSGAKLAMGAAVLVVTGATLIGAAMGETVKGRCFGVNGCKGQGNCKSTKSGGNACKGQNACAKQGWLEMLQADCSDKQGQWEAI